MRLNGLIAALERLPADAGIVFDGGGHPGGFDSYRGYYDHLALGTQPAPQTVGGLLAAARAAVGATFYGWKGGTYTMKEDTPVWRDEPGEWSNVGIMGVALEGDSSARIITADVSDYQGW